MPGTPETRRDELGELRTWYLRSLRPKLAQAARAETVTPRDVVALDRQLVELLGLRSQPEAEGAA